MNFSHSDSVSVDVVLVPHIMAAFQEEGGANLTQDVMMDRDAVGRVVDRMFVRTSQEAVGCVRAGGAEEACSLMFRLLERSVPVLSLSPL